MTKLKRKQRRKRFTTVSRALEEVVGLIPEDRLLRVKNNRKGRYCLSLPCTWLDLHMTSMTMLNGSFPSPVGYKKNSALNQFVILLLYAKLHWQPQIKCICFKSKKLLEFQSLMLRDSACVFEKRRNKTSTLTSRHYYHCYFLYLPLRSCSCFFTRPRNFWYPFSQSFLLSRKEVKELNSLEN